MELTDNRKKKKPRPITLVQPNKVTNARHNYDERQENIMTLMIEAVKNEMTKVTPIQTDLFGEPMIVIDTKDVSSKNKSHYLRSAKGMMRKVVSYEWTDSETKQKTETHGVLITTVHDVKESSVIKLTINKWAIPYLLYWGVGVGGTVFNKSIALTLRGSYTKRIYKLCKRWQDKGGFSMALNEFRDMLCLEAKYPKSIELRRRVLDPAKQRMEEGADVYFDYSLTKIGGSRSYNQINFSIKGNDKNLKKSEKTDMYQLVYNMLIIAYPRIQSTKALDTCERISQSLLDYEKLHSRLKRLKNELDVGEKSIEDISKLIKHLMKTDYANY